MENRENKILEDMYRIDRRTFLKLAGITAGTLAVGGLSVSAAKPPAPVTLDPKIIPKYTQQLIVPPIYLPDTTTYPGNDYYIVSMTQFTQQILPTLDAAGLPTGFGPTTVWGYGGNILGPTFFRNAPAATFVAARNKTVKVLYKNQITGNHLFPVDPTLHWANPRMFTMPFPLPGPLGYPTYPPGFDGNISLTNPQGFNAQSPVPLVPHLHGGEVHSTSDGHPGAWFTALASLDWMNFGDAVDPSVKTVNVGEVLFTYPNAQPPTTLWYHDHALGITRINVMSGLAGYYLLRDPTDPFDSWLTTNFPYGTYEIPVVIQDRSFYVKDLAGNNELWFPTVGLNILDHPYWMPEFFGNTIMVNGKIWPNFNVNAGWYRLRLLNGSNARFYTLNFSNKQSFIQIGSDGGYLQAPATLTSLTIAPGERADILVDFSALGLGAKIILENTAKAPFPNGAPADPQTVGQIMQFTGTGVAGVLQNQNPITVFRTLYPTQPFNPTLTGVFPTLPATTTTRTLTLNEVMGPAGPMMIVLNGQMWSAAISELPTSGTTEEWEIVNLTADTHPIHLHLVQFQLVSRQPFQVSKYLNDWLALQYAPTPVPAMPLPLIAPTKTLATTPYLQGKPIGPMPNEKGWKDTIQTNKGEVTRFRVRFAPIDGSTSYPFNPKTGPGYVWHCHIIDHEDNEMMRPYKVL